MIQPVIVKKGRYPKDGDGLVIELAAPDYHHLFDNRDPAKFRLRDLDDDAVEYLLASTNEVTHSRLRKIRIYFNQDEGAEIQTMVRESIHNYFSYEADLMDVKIGSTLKEGLKFLAIGLTFLSFSIVVSLILKPHTDSFFALFFKEGLLLLGWVSMWKPVNVFLYDWLPLRDLKTVYKKLSEVKIEFLVLNK
jgi:hypothetical protein